MKKRTDFVSNSSSSSFIVYHQKELDKFLSKYSKLFADLHNLILTFATKQNYEKAKDIINEAKIKYPDFIDDKYLQIRDGDPNGEYDCEKKASISFGDCKIITRYPEIFIQCYELSESLELYIADSWGDHNFRMHQILTLLEDRGFKFDELYSDEGWLKMSEDVSNHEIPF